MQLFELVSPRLFRPLAGPNRAFYAELLLLLWEECRHTADYSILRAEAVSRAEDYFAALAKPLALDADDAGDEAEQPTRDPHTLALGFLLRLRRTGWLTEQPGSYEEEPALAFVPEVTPLLEALEEILNPRVVTYTGKLYKAWQLLQNVGEEKSPYENVLREVAGDLEALNRSLRALNASIGHYIDRLTRNRTPQEVLELFDQYEEKVVAAAYHRFKTSDNLFNYRAYLEEELDDCEANHLPRLALDYARVEHCAPGEAAPAVRALIQKLRDSLEEMSTLMRQIDQSHIRYRKRAVQRAQFLLLSDRSAQGSVTALLRRYAPKRRITQAARSIFCRKPVLRRIGCSLHVLRKARQSPFFACTLHSLHVAQSLFTTKSVLYVTDAVASPSLGCQSSTGMCQSQRIGTAANSQQVMSIRLQQIFNCFAQLVDCRCNLPHSISPSAAVQTCRIAFFYAIKEKALSGVPFH